MDCEAAKRSAIKPVPFAVDRRMHESLASQVWTRKTIGAMPVVPNAVFPNPEKSSDEV